MTFYHCLFGGYGPNGPMAGVGHVGAAFIRRRSPIIPALPRSFPLGSQGVQATIFKKTLFVCSPGAAVENAQFFRFVKILKIRLCDLGLLIERPKWFFRGKTLKFDFPIGILDSCHIYKLL